MDLILWRKEVGEKKRKGFGGGVRDRLSLWLDLDCGFFFWLSHGYLQQLAFAELAGWCDGVSGMIPIIFLCFVTHGRLFKNSL